MPATALPTLRLSLQLDGSDPFGAMEWIFASARRTGLSPQQLRFDTGLQTVLHATLSAGDADLLWLFLRRLDSGIDMALLCADVDDPHGEPACDAVAQPAPRVAARRAASNAALALPA